MTINDIGNMTIKGVMDWAISLCKNICKSRALSRRFPEAPALWGALEAAQRKVDELELKTARNPAELVAYQSAYAVKELLPLASYGLAHMLLKEGLSKESQERFNAVIRLSEEVLEKINSNSSPAGGFPN